MVSLTERLRAKFGTKPSAGDAQRSSTPPSSSASAPTPTEDIQETDDNASAPGEDIQEAGPDVSNTDATDGISQRLWNSAYDKLKQDEAATIAAYEKILSSRLNEQDVTESQQNVIADDPRQRRLQMQKLVDLGLAKTEKEAKVKERVGTGLQTVLALKGVVDKAIQASPQGAIAWVGVCFALEILMNPITEDGANRQGITHVLSQMDWYWHMSNLLLEENFIKQSSHAARQQLEQVITGLYQKLLLYQIKSVCNHYRRRLAVFMRDLVKLQDWNGALSDIKSAEAAVQAASLQYNTASSRSLLGEIAENSKSLNENLTGLVSALQEQTRQQERRHETAADNRCLADLRLSDPRDDKKRIEETKGGLLEDIYAWILDNPDFKEWRDGEEKRLLWVRGDPGKGKTMLLCGVINELKRLITGTDALSFFLCQATDSRLNSAAAIVRGLVYTLLDENRTLMPHLRQRYDTAGRALFEDANALFALTEILETILQDPSISTLYLAIDGLDECQTELPEMLKFISKLSTCPKVRIIVSSRNWNNIEEELDRSRQGASLSLELNAAFVTNAVQLFTARKVAELANRKGYKETLQSSVFNYMFENADNTFLWVALACQMLENTSPRNVLKKLKDIPPTLDDLYQRMMRHVEASEDAPLCQEIIATCLIAYRPLHLQELASLVEPLEDYVNDLATTKEIVGLCGSFLTLRDCIVYFIHQSAKDYLLKETESNIIPLGRADTHLSIVRQSLKAMSMTLERDIYGIKSPGCGIDDVPQPKPDPLGAVKYSIDYWVDHLWKVRWPSENIQIKFMRDGGLVEKFLRNHYLHWLEALSLGRSMAKGIRAIAKLKVQVQVEPAPSLNALVEDAHIFAMTHWEVIEGTPLQVYVSALLFSPSKSEVLQNFQREKPNWVRISPSPKAHWTAQRQVFNTRTTLEQVALSPCFTMVASGSDYGNLKIWNLSENRCIHALEAHENEMIVSVDFSKHSLLVSSSFSYTFIWEPSGGKCLKTLPGANYSKFAHKLNLLAWSAEGKINICEVMDWADLLAIDLHGENAMILDFSHDSTLLVAVVSDETMRIWEIGNGTCLKIIQTGPGVLDAKFSFDASLVVSASVYSAASVWETSSGSRLFNLDLHGETVHSVAFLHESSIIASGTVTDGILLWDAKSGEYMQALTGHRHLVSSLSSFEHESILASASWDGTVRIWEAPVREKMQKQLLPRTVDGQSRKPRLSDIVFCPGDRVLATVSARDKINIWDVEKSTMKQTLNLEKFFVTVAVSPDANLLAFATLDEKLMIWDIESGTYMHTLTLPSIANSLSFSKDSSLLAFVYGNERKLGVCDVAGGKTVLSVDLPGPDGRGYVCCTCFSHDGSKIAIVWKSGNAQIIRISCGETTGEIIQQICHETEDFTRSAAFLPGETMLAMANTDKLQGNMGCMEIWDWTTKEKVRSIYVGFEITFLSFSDDGFAITNHGVFSPGRMHDTVDDADNIEDEEALVSRLAYTGLWFEGKDWWIGRREQRLVRIPEGYRGNEVVVIGDKVAVQEEGGDIVWYTISEI